MVKLTHLCLSILLGPATLASASAAGPEQSYPPVSEARAERAPRVSWFWINGAAGYQTINLRTFDAGQDDFTIGLIPESKAGPTVDVGLGARLLFVTLGARFTGGFFRDASEDRSLGSYQLWSLDGELGVHLPFGRFEPYVQVAAGYSALGGLADAVAGLRRGVDIAGINTRLAFGFDYYVGRRVSLGLRGSGELLFLSRRGVPVRELLEPKQVDTLGELKTRLLEANGSTVGTALGLGGNIGLHF
jgi:hypothetical protein